MPQHRGPQHPSYATVHVLHMQAENVLLFQAEFCIYTCVRPNLETPYIFRGWKYNVCIVGLPAVLRSNTGSRGDLPTYTTQKLQHKSHSSAEQDCYSRTLIIIKLQNRNLLRYLTHQPNKN